jgi:SAM-dependent methyltransferase
MKEFWNDRYAAKEFAYGKKPNVFLKQELDKLEKGKIFLPADGEGRNSVYAAKNGWEAYACDLSVEGKKKTEKLAFGNGVQVDYAVGDFGALAYEDHFFDAIALIFAHFPSEKKKDYHQLVDQYLRIGGTIIFEAFGKNHLKYNSEDPKVGGPRDLGMLYSVEELKSDFPNYDIIVLEEMETDLNEGQFHVGRGSVVRFVARKVS